MSLRWRLALFIAGLIALAVLAQGAVGYARFERLGLEEADRTLLGAMQSVARPPRRGPRFENRGGPPPGALTELEPRVRVVRNGVVLRQTGEAIPTDLAPPERGLVTQGAWRVAATQLPNGDRIEGAVYLLDQQRSARNYLESLLLTVPLFAGFGALAAWFISGAALRPLEALIQVSSRVADSGDLAQRVPQASGGGELTRLSTTFNRMLERLQAFRTRETSFTRTAAHELRTPLTAMRAQLEAQAQGWTTPEEALTTARTQVERMTKLSEALLMLARENQIEMAQLDLAQLAQHSAERYGVAYTGPSSLMTRGNAVLLERALENLLENAQKHAPEARVEVKLETHQDGLRISVTDNGQGMTSEALTRASEAFYRAPGTKAYGSGLGLAVVERIAQAHGGAFKLENAGAPSGLCATLELPLDRP
jgi:signal transduction histidine kinase